MNDWESFIMQQDINSLKFTGLVSATKIDEIPFPAVTICNVNNIQKSLRSEQIRWLNFIFDYQLLRKNIWILVLYDVCVFSKAERSLRGDWTDDEDLLRTFACLLDIYHICNSAVSFIDNFAPGESPDIRKIESEMHRRTPEFIKYLRPSHTMREVP